MTQTPRNPFEHHHPHHDHDHDHAAELETLDPAQQSLADALRVSFAILKIVMVVLVIYYGFSGIFTVASDERAVRLRFGRIVEVDSASGRQVLDEGAHFAWPYPVEQVVKVPRAPRQISLNREFWYYVDPQLAASGRSQPSMSALDPQRDGSVLTGDANIAHTRWTVTYSIADPVAFITNVADPASPRRITQTADALVRVTSEQGVVHAVAQATADAVQRRVSAIEETARLRAQEALDAMNSGLQITAFAFPESEFPGAVRDAFKAVNDAETEKALRVERANEQRTQVLVDTAGEAREELLRLVEQFELASASGDEQRRGELRRRLDEAFDRGYVETQDGRRVPISGRVSETINAAKTFRTQHVAQVKADVDRFESLLAEYERSPEIVRSKQWTSMLNTVMARKINPWWVPAGAELIVILGKDPAIQKHDDQEKLQQQQPGGQ